MRSKNIVKTLEPSLKSPEWEILSHAVTSVVQFTTSLVCDSLGLKPIIHVYGKWDGRVTSFILSVIRLHAS